MNKTEKKNGRMLSREKELELVKDAKAGDGSAERDLIEATLPAALKYARRAATRKGAVRERDKIGDLALEQDARIGLFRAIKRFDPDRGVRLLEFAKKWIAEVIQRRIEKDYAVVKLGKSHEATYGIRARDACTFTDEPVPSDDNDGGDSNETIGSTFMIAPPAVSDGRKEFETRVLINWRAGLQGDKSAIAWFRSPDGNTPGSLRWGCKKYSLEEVEDDWRFKIREPGLGLKHVEVPGALGGRGAGFAGSRSMDADAIRTRFETALKKKAPGVSREQAIRCLIDAPGKDRWLRIHLLVHLPLGFNALCRPGNARIAEACSEYVAVAEGKGLRGLRGLRLRKVRDSSRLVDARRAFLQAPGLDERAALAWSRWHPGAFSGSGDQFENLDELRARVVTIFREIDEGLKVDHALGVAQARKFVDRLLEPGRSDPAPPYGERKKVQGVAGFRRLCAQPAFVQQVVDVDPELADADAGTWVYLGIACQIDPPIEAGCPGEFAARRKWWGRLVRAAIWARRGDHAA